MEMGMVVYHRVVLDGENNLADLLFKSELATEMRREL
jgi:hypothetical protein